MNKFLLGTTAVVSAGLVAGMTGETAAADRIRLGLAGYHQQWVVSGTQDYSFNRKLNPGRDDNTTSTNVVDQKHNSEICFIGESTLDNGITFGVNVELETNTDFDQIDESYLYVSSPAYGRLIAGDLTNVGYLMHVSAPSGGVSVDSGDTINNYFWENPNLNYWNTAIGTTYLRFRDDGSGKLSYLSPRVGGTQLGVSFIPQFETGGDSNNGRRIGGDVRNNQINNGWAGGFNYIEDFNGVGVKLSGGVMYGNVGADAATGDGDDLLAYNLGSQFSYSGFSFGGAYSTGEGGRGRGGEQVNSNSWIVGATYEFGSYTVGVNYMKGSGNRHNAGLTTNGTAHLDQAVLSGTWQLGPGIRLVGGFFWFDAEDELNHSSDTRFVDPGPTSDPPGSENDGFGFTTALKLGF